MNEREKLIARIGTARDAISKKKEQTGLDFMIDGVLMNCAVMLKEPEAVVPDSDNWTDLCPICEYPFERCQCRFGGSAHPDRSDRARVVFDHLYLLSSGQLDHVMHVQSFWQTSYADEKRNKIFLYLIHQAKKGGGLNKPFIPDLYDPDPGHTYRNE